MLRVNDFYSCAVRCSAQGYGSVGVVSFRSFRGAESAALAPQEPKTGYWGRRSSTFAPRGAAYVLLWLKWSTACAAVKPQRTRNTLFALKSKRGAVAAPLCMFLVKD